MPRQPVSTRPLTRNQVLENRAFLRALRKTGSANAAARESGCKRTTMERRRDVHPSFKLAWDAALVIADAALTRRRDGVATRHDRDEPRIIRGKTGKLQLRRARRLQLTTPVRQRFLLALSASANIALSAAAAGFSQWAFYQLRKRDPGFAREWRFALLEGYRRLEQALMAGFLPDAHEDDGWRNNDAPDLPLMTPAQALQLLYLHQKEALLPWSATYLKRRRSGEPEAVRDARITAEYASKVKRQAEDTTREALDKLAASLPPSPHEEPIALPDLSQVTGWSTASGKPPRDPNVALFGGFRVQHLTDEQRRKARG